MSRCPQTIEDVFQHEEAARRALGDEVGRMYETNLAKICCSFVNTSPQVWTDIIEAADAAYASPVVFGPELIKSIRETIPFYRTGFPQFVFPCSESRLFTIVHLELTSLPCHETG